MARKKKSWTIALPGKDEVKNRLEKHWSGEGTWQEAYRSAEPYAIPTVEWHKQPGHALECDGDSCRIVKLDGAEPAKKKIGFWARIMPRLARREEPQEIVARAFNKLHTGTFHVGTLEQVHDAPPGARVIVKLSDD